MRPAWRRRPLTTAGHLRRISLALLLLTGLCLPWADLEIVNVDPLTELGRMGMGLLTPDLLAVDNWHTALINTLAFALLGVALGAAAGFLLALVYDYWLVRVLCTSLRAVHELFWALIFMQLAGLHAITGILAIAIPYAGTFARVFHDMLRQTSPLPAATLPGGTDRLSRFAYTSLPLAWPDLVTYSRYRLECGIRSSTVLGFIGLPTLGFHLETTFSQGLYDQASALLYGFFLLILTQRYWLKPALLPMWLTAAWLWLPPLPDLEGANIVRFLTVDIVPGFLQPGSEPASLQTAWHWLGPLLTGPAGEGLVNTLILTLLGLVASGLIGLSLFPLISRHCLRRPARAGGHLLLVVLRSIPELILTYLGLLLLGPSMLPAMLALGLHNGAIVAHLAGNFSNHLQLRIDAVSGLNRYWYELLPRVYRPFLAFLFYRSEVIMRETAILGMVGIKTLGFYIDSAFEAFRLDHALALIILTALLNIAMDSLSRRLQGGLQMNIRIWNG